MSIDAKPSTTEISPGLPNPFKNTTTEIQPQKKTKEQKEFNAQKAKSMVDVVYQEGLQIYSADQEINKKTEETVKDITKSHENIRPIDAGYKEVATKAKPLIERIEEKLREVKKTSVDNGMEQSQVRQILFNLIDELVANTDSQQIQEILNRAESIFRQNVSQSIERRQKVKRARGFLYKTVEDNSDWARHHFFNTQNETRINLDQTPVDRFAKQSKTSLNTLDNLFTSANSLDFNFQKRIEEANHYFLESLKEIARSEK